MAKIIEKLHSKNGESLIEALSAILIIAITSSILVIYIQSSARINDNAKAAFEVYANQMNAAETRVKEGETVVVLNGVDMSVNYSGSIAQDEIHVYWR